MNKTDMLIYIHPGLDAQKRVELERMVEGKRGVDCAEFDSHSHYHAMMVRYDPDSIEGIQILETVRRTDPIASMVGL